MNAHFHRLFKNLALVLAVPCLVSISLAQTAPKLASPLPRSAWVVEYKYDSPTSKNVPTTVAKGMEVPAQAPAQVKSREFTLNDNVARSITRYTDGKTVTAYMLNGICVRENPLETTDLILEELSAGWMVQSNFRRSYLGVDWVTPANYKGIVEYKGAPCHYFQKVSTSSGSEPAQKNGSENMNIIMNSGRAMNEPSLFDQREGEIWIAADGRPVTAKVGNVTSTFTHVRAEAVETITVPARFVAKVQAYAESLNPKSK